MKLVRPSWLLLPLTLTTACAQGTLSINSATGTKPRIEIDGINATPADNVWVQVLVAGATSLSGTASEPFQLTLGGANAGLFSKGTLTVGGKPGGATVDVTIRAWDKDEADDYLTACFKNSQTFSVTLGGAIDSNGIAGLPASIIGPDLFGGFVLFCPEPTTYALAAIGLAGFIFCRRK